VQLPSLPQPYFGLAVVASCAHESRGDSTRNVKGRCVRVKFSRATVNIEQMGANLLDDMYEQKASNLKQVISRRNKMGAKHIAIIVRT
jgi:hypothetical protein